MVRRYRLAKELNFSVKAFGPLMTRGEAEHWQQEMLAMGKTVVIVNSQSL